ncbi:hypothetical protein [Mitsuaria sp. GD03876]|uniref:hypothetical protein n=1 Tax=Mitsuaria sp. GD03876 TaxID=2975399 RepID=UPI00244A739F|nr:hypothetical protein [Mitsuaria sp. GD03876]MDH0866142.1 hypothetical protein [Mitsuaria sp. GD03876]
MNAADLKQTLWRVVYTKNANLQSGGSAVGPWHPDKRHVEQCARVLRGLTHEVGIQSNAQAAKNATTWLKEG